MTVRDAAIAAFIIIAAAAAVELRDGPPADLHLRGDRLWVGSRDSPQDQPDAVDWYSLSHVVHGLLFYALLWLVFAAGRSSGASSPHC